VILGASVMRQAIPIPLQRRLAERKLVRAGPSGSSSGQVARFDTPISSALCNWNVVRRMLRVTNAFG